MQVIRRRIRSFFALQAALLLLVVVSSLLRPAHTHSSAFPLRYYALLTVYLLFGLVFAAAWWTTRKPSAARNPSAIAASVISLVIGSFLLWTHHGNLEFASTGLVVLAIGAGGLYLFAQGGVPSSSSSATSLQPVVAMRKATPVAGDRTHPGMNLLVIAITLLAEGAAIFYWSFWSRSHHLTTSGSVPWFILFTCAVLISTVLHECGHAFFAWGCYMKLLSFNAGPLQWRKREGNWQFKFHPTGFVELGGSVRVVPTNPDQPRAHEFWTLAAGPLANIFFGFLLLWATLDGGWPFYAQAWRLAAFTSSFCFIAAITNLLPFMTEDGGYSDGARILQVLTKSPLDDYHRTLNSIAATLVTARRCRDLDVAAIERAADRFPQDLRGLNLRLCAANFYLDSDRLPEARTALAAAEAIYDAAAIDLPAPLHTAFVFGHACLNHNAVAARLWWDRMEAKKSVLHSVDYWLASAALQWVEDHPREADEAWQKADALAEKLPEFGAYDFDRSRCTLLRKEIAQPSPVPAAATPATPPPSRNRAEIPPTPAPAPAAPETPAIAAQAPLDRVVPTPAPAIPEALPTPAIPAPPTPSRIHVFPFPVAPAAAAFLPPMPEVAAPAIAASAANRIPVVMSAAAPASASIPAPAADIHILLAPAAAAEMAPSIPMLLPSVLPAAPFLAEALPAPTAEAITVLPLLSPAAEPISEELVVPFDETANVLPLLPTPFLPVAEAIPEPLPIPAARTVTPSPAPASVTRIPMNPPAPAPDPADKPRFDPLQFLRPTP